MAKDDKYREPDSSSFNMDLSNEAYAVPRREIRHDVPRIYQNYIDLKIKSGPVYERVVLHNISRNGIQFESKIPFDVDSEAECLVSVLRSLSKNVAFSIHVKYCLKKEENFLVGAAIRKIADSTWFNIFLEVHDFIVSRQGTVY